MDPGFSIPDNIGFLEQLDHVFRSAKQSSPQEVDQTTPSIPSSTKHPTTQSLGYTIMADKSTWSRDGYTQDPSGAANTQQGQKSSALASAVYSKSINPFMDLEYPNFIKSDPDRMIHSSAHGAAQENGNTSHAVFRDALLNSRPHEWQPANRAHTQAPEHNSSLSRPGRRAASEPNPKHVPHRAQNQKLSEPSHNEDALDPLHHDSLSTFSPGMNERETMLLRRKLRNRASAKRSRLKREKEIQELEMNYEECQKEMYRLKQDNMRLRMQNERLNIELMMMMQRSRLGSVPGPSNQTSGFPADNFMEDAYNQNSNTGNE
jgi:hypothetical protein